MHTVFFRFSCYLTCRCSRPKETWTGTSSKGRKQSTSGRCGQKGGAARRGRRWHHWCRRSWWSMLVECSLYSLFHFFFFNAVLFCIQVTVIISQLMKRPGPNWLPVTPLLLPALHHLPLPHGNVHEGWWGHPANSFLSQVNVNLAFWVTKYN